MKLVNSISTEELKKLAGSMYGNLVKAVVDIHRNILILDAPMHVDLEEKLLQEGSKQANLWGINLHPGKYKTDEFIEFDSMINIRPSQNNLSRDVLDKAVRKKIIELVAGIVHE